MNARAATPESWTTSRFRERSAFIGVLEGRRFVVPVATVHAGPNPKYFGIGRGVTYYNLTSNQFTGLNAITRAGHLTRQPGLARGGPRAADRVAAHPDHD
jgi:Tn3 transposase DDE domain